jgi:hypothetical protein
MTFLPSELRDPRITRRELYGTRFEWLLWSGLILGPPLFMLYGLAKYPPLVPDPRKLTFLALGVFAVSALLILVVQKKLMPWGDKAPVIMWLTTFSLSIIPAMGANGLFVLANAKLDRSPSAEVRTVIDRVNNRKGVTLHSVVHPADPIFFALTQNDHDNVERGDSIRLQVKPGAFGMPWISGYTLRRIPEFTPRPRTQTSAPFAKPQP